MIDQIQPSQLPDWISSKSASGNTVVLDVREPYEVQTACVTANGFELVTLPMGSIVEKLSELDKDRPIACLCHHGSRSMQVAAYLSSQGFTHLANIEGGIHAWSSQVDPHVPTY
ncbi:MAG: rhodanese-like domain-containing protein [Burkholderiales bacterium]|jgi:rhodanese-related sulfurtransferase|nr:rhodanese-like domain-containing protein [Burkholderiales bacterium]